jgi:hypothetical protein
MGEHIVGKFKGRSKLLFTCVTKRQPMMPEVVWLPCALMFAFWRLTRVFQRTNSPKVQPSAPNVAATAMLTHANGSHRNTHACT